MNAPHLDFKQSVHAARSQDGCSLRRKFDGHPGDVQEAPFLEPLDRDGLYWDPNFTDRDRDYINVLRSPAC